jgi:hypothetical protein
MGTKFFNTLPTYEQPLTSRDGKVTTRGWYTYWAGLFEGQPTGPVAPLVVGPSPFTYLATQAGSVIVKGGTVSKIEFTRGDGNFYGIGQTAGMFPLAKGDSLVVTYSVAPPNATFVPR